MTTEQRKIIAKIQKLLKLSSSNYNGESEAALLKAQQLLIEYDLSMADIGGSTDKQAVTEEILEFKSLPWWYGSLIVIIVKNFRCEALAKKNKSNGKDYIIIGRETDVIVSKEVFKYAIAIIKHNSKQFKTYGTAQVNTYILGFLRGLTDKYQAQIEENQWGLILVKDKEVIDAKERYSTKKTRQTRINRTSDQETYNQGYTDGKTLDHERKQIQAGGTVLNCNARKE